MLNVLRGGGRTERHLLARLVKGLNRIFVGVFVNTEREVLLATSLSFSTAKVSQILEDRIPVTPRLHERVELVLSGDKPVLVVQFAPDTRAELPLNLTRFEFLESSRRGGACLGAFPGSATKTYSPSSASFSLVFRTADSSKAVLMETVL